MIPCKGRDRANVNKLPLEQHPYQGKENKRGVLKKKNQSEFTSTVYLSGYPRPIPDLLCTCTASICPVYVPERKCVPVPCRPYIPPVLPIYVSKCVPVPGKPIPVQTFVRVPDASVSSVRHQYPSPETSVSSVRHQYRHQQLR